MTIGNHFTGKQLKIINVKGYHGVYGIHAYKVDTTPDDPDFEMLDFTNELIKMGVLEDENNYIHIACIKQIALPSEER